MAMGFKVFSKKCLRCIEYKNCRDNFSSWLFFFIGIIATISIRVVSILLHISSFWAQFSWYVGVVGFLIYFAYKFKIDQRRSRAIRNNNLILKLSQEEKLSRQEKDFLIALLCAFSSKKDRINYFLIFVTSALALVITVIMDILNR